MLDGTMAQHPQRTQRKRVPREWQVRRRRLAAAHSAGYASHQEQLQRSRAARAWVRRPDCWVGSVPDRDDRPPATGGDVHGMRRKAAS